MPLASNVFIQVNENIPIYVHIWFFLYFLFCFFCRFCGLSSNHHHPFHLYFIWLPVFNKKKPLACLHTKHYHFTFLCSYFQLLLPKVGRTKFDLRPQIIENTWHTIHFAANEHPTWCLISRSKGNANIARGEKRIHTYEWKTCKKKKKDIFIFRLPPAPTPVCLCLCWMSNRKKPQDSWWMRMCGSLDKGQFYVCLLDFTTV